MPLLFYQHLLQVNITSKIKKYTISYLSTRWNAAWSFSRWQKSVWWRWR